MIRKIIVVFCVVSSAWAIEDLSFPPGFKFGVASAAFQVEGAWNVSDKSESIWDWYIPNRPGAITDGSNGDVACDSYHQWRRDIEMIEEVGAHFYRFSISWPRLLPTGFSNKISEDGARYYSDLIDGLLEKGIEPFITIYHWDLPQSLQDLGGWTNPLVADWLADYARVVYSLYADRVKTWITINEPVVICDVTYNHGSYAPGIIDPEVGTFLCIKNTLIAHAKAWRIYDEEFRPQYHGKVSMANNFFWFEPATPEDAALAELAMEYMGGIYSHPIYSAEGGWPPTMEKAVAEYSLRLGYAETNLPPFTTEEIKLVKGTFDFYALNHYTSRVIRPARKDEPMHPWPFGDAPCINGKLSGHPDWKPAQSSWFFLNPEGMRAQLAWLKKHYGNLNIIITENGYPNSSGLRDHDKITFYKTYLKQLLLSIKEDGVNVTGYTAWTLMDNFEWADGYSSKFGLYEVDFNSANRTRTPRSSAKYYSSIIKAHSLEVDTNVL